MRRAVIQYYVFRELCFTDLQGLFHKSNLKEPFKCRLKTNGSNVTSIQSVANDFVLEILGGLELFKLRHV